MKLALSWLREFVDLPESPQEIRNVLDDLGLVVEAIDHFGEGLDDVIVARVDEIRAIKGADKIRLVVVDAGNGPLEIVCGADNFVVGNHVPLAPVGAVLPGGFTIALRQMRGVTSNGMLCSANELGLSDDHRGLMVLDDLITPHVGENLMTALSITPDVVFDISVEGNRPDAWSLEGVARDLATRMDRELRFMPLAKPNTDTPTSAFAHGGIEDPTLCGRLTVSVLRNVTVGPSPAWIVQRLRSAGMRDVSNVVDASNLVMLELGQPTHPYDAAQVAKHTLRARRARSGETLVTLDGVNRELAMAGRGLGDTGEDCVIVDGDDRVLGLAGIMGGSMSEISDSTTEVLLEAAYFDPMTIARSSKRHGLRSEASNRFERGVDPHLALRAASRFVAVLRESNPDLEWLADPIDVWGVVPEAPTIQLRPGDIERTLGASVPQSETVRLLQGLNFRVEERMWTLHVTPPSSRPDVRTGAAGRADVIEEVARLYSYARLGRRSPAWSQPGGMTARQRLRRQLRDVVVDLGVYEAWTPTLGSESDFDLLHAGVPRVRITNPLVSDESVLRATMLSGLVKAWVRNVERGTGDVVLGELGTVFVHPDATSEPRTTKGGAAGSASLRLPLENERFTVVLGRVNDDATSAVGLWSMVADRLGLADVVVRSINEAPAGFHPTRSAVLMDRASGAALGLVGEVDRDLLASLGAPNADRRLGVVDIDLDAVADCTKATRRDSIASVPSRYPSAIIDLAFVTPDGVHACDLASTLRAASPLVEEVTLFDVFRSAMLAPGTRSVAYNIRLGSPERTLSDAEVGSTRDLLIESVSTLGAVLR